MTLGSPTLSKITYSLPTTLIISLSPTLSLG
nr:MAG TPA: hypothetical protein [Caudoviricetes sp.]